MEDRLEGTSNFNTWKERVLNTLEEHDLDVYTTIVVEESTTNVGRFNFKKNQAKDDMIIYDLVKGNLMSMITLLKTTKECVDTLMNLYEKKALSQNMDLKYKIWNLNMEKDKDVA